MAKLRHRVTDHSIVSNWTGAGNGAYPTSGTTDAALILLNNVFSEAHGISVEGRTLVANDFQVQGGLLWSDISADLTSAESTMAIWAGLTHLPIVHVTTTTVYVIPPPCTFSGTTRGAQRTMIYDVTVYVQKSLCAGSSDAI